VLIFAHFHDTLQVFHACFVSDLILSAPTVHDQPPLHQVLGVFGFAQKQDSPKLDYSSPAPLDPCAVAKYSSAGNLWHQSKPYRSGEQQARKRQRF
jgi:hypothetical protein